MQTISELWRSLLPLVQQEIAKVSSRATGTSGGLATHALDGAYHSGSLGDSQAPQFAKLDGSRAFTGNLTFVGAQTVDGVDISVHAANASAHHAPVTAGTLIGLSGQQVSVANGSAQYQVPVTGASPFTPAYTALSGMAGDGLTFGSGAFAVGAGTLISVGANDISLANGSAQYQVPVTGASPFTPAFTALSGMAGDGLTFGSGAFAVGVANTGATGLTVEANAVRLTSSNNTGAAAAILATDATGTVTVPHVVGGTDVATPALKSSAALAITSSAGDISLDASTNAIKIGASNTVKADNYASQTTGWAIDYDGGADFRYLFTDELHAKSFIADLEQALAGGQIVSKSVAILAVDFTAPAAGATATLRVKDLPSAANMAVFQSGDIVRLRKFSRSGGALSISDCWGAVTSYADQSDGTQTWTFTRSTAPNAGAMTASTVVDADSIVLDYGTSGNGFYEVNAIDGTYAANSPYWQIVSWSGHPATGQTVNVRGGKLTGITSTANEYGIFAGTGTTASDSYLIASTEGATQNNISSAWTSGGTSLVTIDPTHGLNLQSYDSSGGVISYGDQRIIGWAASLPSSSPDGVIWTQYSTTQNEMHVEARQTGSRAGLIQLAAYGEAASGNYADTVLLTMAGAESSATRSYLNVRADDVEIDLGNGSANIGKLSLYAKQLLVSDGSSSDDGSATNPAYSFLNDPDTGIYRSAANQINIATGGASRIQIGTAVDVAVDFGVTGISTFNTGGSGGNFIIGTPGGTTGFSIINTKRSDVRWDDSSLYLLVSTSASAPATTNGISIAQGGNVGIKTAAATRVLQVTGNAFVNQNSTTLATAALEINQADVSEELIDFQSTVATGNAINTDALGSYYGRVRVAVNGTFKWLALYN